MASRGWCSSACEQSCTSEEGLIGGQSMQELHSDTEPLVGHPDCCLLLP